VDDEINYDVAKFAILIVEGLKFRFCNRMKRRQKPNAKRNVTFSTNGDYNSFPFYNGCQSHSIF